MIPGSSATENHFDRLVAKLNQNNSRPHSLLKVKVMNDDSLHFTGQTRRGDNEPIIVVGFENTKMAIAILNSKLVDLILLLRS